jgi:hypothetical protein
MDGAFDNIDMKFQDIELFLQTFPDDDNIDEASIDLVVAAFAAIESVIGFLIQSIREFCLFLSFRAAQRTLWSHF